jgi:molecular chaperone GrpE (heat shock protein)
MKTEKILPEENLNSIPDTLDDVSANKQAKNNTHSEKSSNKYKSYTDKTKLQHNDTSDVSNNTMCQHDQQLQDTIKDLTKQIETLKSTMQTMEHVKQKELHEQRQDLVHQFSRQVAINKQEHENEKYKIVKIVANLISLIHKPQKEIEYHLNHDKPEAKPQWNMMLHMAQELSTDIMEQVVHKLHLKELTANPNESFNSKIHTAVEIVATDQKEKHNTVASVRRNGVMYNESLVIKPVEVVLYQLKNN